MAVITGVNTCVLPLYYEPLLGAGRSPERFSTAPLRPAKPPRPKGAKDPTKPVIQTSKTTLGAYQILPTFWHLFLPRNSSSKTIIFDSIL